MKSWPLHSKIMLAVLPIVLTFQGWCVGEIMKSKYTHLDRADERRILDAVERDAMQREGRISEELAKINARLDLLTQTQIEILIAVEAKKESS